MKRNPGVYFMGIFLLFSVWTVGADKEKTLPPIVIGMSHPTPAQIDNIVVLREKGLLQGDHIHLLGIYHEDERTGYDDSRKYVRKKELDWVKFYVIHGKVSDQNLYARNAWTQMFSEVFSRISGVIFTGGSDLPPSAYGEPHFLMSDPETPVRSRMDLSFIFHLLGGERNRDFTALLVAAPDFPVLGICLGAQEMNVAGGGTLWQDIPMQIYGFQTAEEVVSADFTKTHSSRYLHMLFPETEGLLPAFHPVNWKAHPVWRKRLFATVNPVWVLSSHHQSIRRLARDLVVLAESMDGRVIEAVAHRRYSHVLGVQFHPEFASLFRSKDLFRETPSGPRETSLTRILSEHPDSELFHRQLWNWLGTAMKQTRNKRCAQSHKE